MGFLYNSKILPKISGSSNEVLEILIMLFTHFNNISDKYNEFITDAELKAMDGKAKDNEYNITNKKLSFMIRRYLQDKEVYFYILMELQSKVDYSMPIRVFQYICEIWRDILRNDSKKNIKSKGFKLPAIIPIVL
ncbi:Rpn family recombination-promoting nuclease/putative transposase [Clostridium gasigenes]|uniref:Rpn family recombination-promoting nuclease/putative transposase n=1 Tax=Clostridium gasigenes TaxID=94869 RepID=UPI0014383EA0|nr:Rpn family recombination-promoting nuclease/putative transposase [Clostridium gasigenes]MBU3138015.1 Rpn family recombination-promoting nuclease/putative transposase [Clostridium gasigenes]NKF05674.1 Rpn family recombination-promoting nuclease/putative transposase [Clostridium gasigenes]QSW19111.1 Rpn family recombination-promoting nuclease/putative transposase [Clostridium gasigenes]